MADRPLRPATDRRLGRQLPHQLPNRTQAAPKAPRGFEPQLPCGISPSFPGLSPTSGYIPTRYSPVRRCRHRPRDLHVLSMPPAFALSQDQTLRFIAPQPISRSAKPTNSSLTHHHIATRPSPPEPTRHQDPARQTPTQGQNPRQRRPRIPLPIPPKQDRQQNTHHRTPPPSHPHKE